MQSIEHQFITDCFLEILEEHSRSNLYSYKEAERGGFDFACQLHKAKTTSIVGQTLKSHAAGIEKDLNWLLLDKDDSLPIYLYSDTAAHSARIGEVIRKFKRFLPERVSLLRLYPYPEFDATVKSERDEIRTILTSTVIDDLILGTLLGNLTRTDIEIFVLGCGIPGLLPASLEYIAVEGFFNYSDVGRGVGAHPSVARDRVKTLHSAGMLKYLENGGLYFITQRGKSFLEICAKIQDQELYDDSTKIVLDSLGLECPTVNNREGFNLKELFPSDLSASLRREIWACQNNFGSTIRGSNYEDDPRGCLDLENGKIYGNFFRDLRWISR